MPTNALEVARCLIHLAAAEEEEDRLSPLRLQKLLYYCQGWSLGLRGEPLFDENIQAWKHGPVVPSVYHAFKHHGFNSIDSETVPPPEGISTEDRSLIDAVWKAYRGFSATSLRSMTHAESPWADTADEGLGWGKTISQEAMQEFFAARAAKNAKARSKTA